MSLDIRRPPNLGYYDSSDGAVWKYVPTTDLTRFLTREIEISQNLFVSCHLPCTSIPSPIWSLCCCLSWMCITAVDLGGVARRVWSKCVRVHHLILRVTARHSLERAANARRSRWDVSTKLRRPEDVAGRFTLPECWI